MIGKGLPAAGPAFFYSNGFARQESIKKKGTQPLEKKKFNPKVGGARKKKKSNRDLRGGYAEQRWVFPSGTSFCAEERLPAKRGKTHVSGRKPAQKTSSRMSWEMSQ